MKKFTMKDWIFKRIQTDLKLRRDVSNARGIDGNSVRHACMNKLSWLSEKTYVEIIKDHLKINDQDIFEISES